MSLVSAARLTKTYGAGEVDVLAVKGIDFTIEARSFVAFADRYRQESALLRPNCTNLLISVEGDQAPSRSTS